LSAVRLSTNVVTSQNLVHGLLFDRQRLFETVFLSQNVRHSRSLLSDILNSPSHRRTDDFIAAEAKNLSISLSEDAVT
jgi:hypothetical protein